MTMQQAARDALDVQDAWNLSGVVHSFAKVTDALWEEARRYKHGTDFVNSHPIAVLFTFKMAQLAGNTLFTVKQFADAYEVCEQLAHPPRERGAA